MAAALPHCDALVSGHSYEALGEVAEAIGARTCDHPKRPTSGGRGSGAMGECDPGARQLRRDAERLGPSRGRTTPGWASK